MRKTKFIPTGDRALVFPYPPDTIADGKIILPERWGKDYNRFRKGVVQSKGRGTPDVDMAQIRVSDVVIYPEGAGFPLVVDGVEHVCLQFDEIVAIV